MDKPEMLSRIYDGWQALVDTVSQVSLGRMSTPGVVEGWSVRDLLGHAMT